MWQKLSIAVSVATVLSLPSCKHGKCEDGGSSTSSRSSHNAGENCRSCHHPDGPGEVCWNIGGTVYDHQGTQPVAAAKVRLFGGPQGTGGVKYELQSDQNGNVYTSEDITFGIGLFPAVISVSGDTAYMTESINDGACNRCHGSSTERIKLP